MENNTPEYRDYIEKYRKWQEQWLDIESRKPVWSGPDDVPAPTPDTKEKIDQVRKFNEGKSPDKIRNTRTRDAVKAVVDAETQTVFKEPPSPYANGKMLWNGQKWVSPNTVEIPYTSRVANTARNITGVVGGMLNRTALPLGALATPVQVYQQFNALNEKNPYDREFGASDPFALRPFVDSALGGRSFVDTVNDPQWVQRNPIAAAPYNLMAGNPEYAKAFANAYLPSWMQFSERKQTQPTYTPQFLYR